jgi:hypothetical protein
MRQMLNLSTAQVQGGSKNAKFYAPLARQRQDRDPLGLAFLFSGGLLSSAGMPAMRLVARIGLIQCPLKKAAP